MAIDKVDLDCRGRSPVDWAGVRLEEAGLHRAGWSRLFRCQLQQPRVLRRQLRCQGTEVREPGDLRWLEIVFDRTHGRGMVRCRPG